jgi:hypothetical protein
VPHTDPAVLALRALGESAGSPCDDEHLAGCPDCRAELTRLADLVQLARQSGPGEPLLQPPPQVWERIAAAAGEMPRLAEADAPDRTAAANPADPRPSPVRRRGRLAAALAGLAAGLIIGIGGTAGIAQLIRSPAPATRVVAQIELRPLPQFPQWQNASGTAVMHTTVTQQVIAVTLTAPPRPGFYEVWLLARNGVSMISLGDLNSAHAGTFTIPPGTDLRNYSRIDVSLQPFNGSTVHSRTSVVRGSLPPAATTS